MDGFFAYYGLASIAIFFSSLVVSLLAAWIFYKIFKTQWIVVVVTLIISSAFYYKGMSFMAFIYLLISIFVILFLIIRKVIKK
ncbi:MAG: hypothetical protein CO141_00465 [Candidatus Moranbacteria bacterium CG_4_9_14_3_um_filter_42_9]|nr:MAG: hypothetical protein CO141_00465 [Candidatus Moranbacteria bacterium CG_4_9_14_3_um_filter_42_9]